MARISILLIWLACACQMANVDCHQYDSGCGPRMYYLLYPDEEIEQADGAVISAATTSVCEDQGFCYIYTATNSGTGWSGGALGGISGADAKCMAEIPGGLPGASTYKALLMASAVREQNLDWVLYADTEYRLQDGTTVVATASSAAVFPFPLTNALGAFFNMWTGMSYTGPTVWTAGNDCGGWTLNTTGSSGDRSSTGTTFIDNNPTRACSGASAVYCVQR